MGQTVSCSAGSTLTVEEKLIECAVRGDLIGTDKWAEKALSEAALRSRVPATSRGMMEVMDASARRALEEDRCQCEVPMDPLFSTPTTPLMTPLSGFESSLVPRRREPSEHVAGAPAFGPARGAS